MKRLNIILSLLCVLAVTMNIQAQSGWTRKKNTYFIKTSFNIFSSDTYYSLSGNKSVSQNFFNQKSLTLYGEYGISDKLTAIINFPMLKLNSFDNTETAAGIGDLKIEFKYALLTKNIPLTIAVAPEFPTGSQNNYAKNLQSNLGFLEQINLPTGDGEFNVWTTLAASHSFHPLPIYISLSTAYNFRTQYNGFSFRDQVKFNFEAGYKLLDKVWLNGTLSAQTSMGKESGTTDFIRGEGTEFTAFGFGAAYEVVKHWSVSLQTWGYADLIFDRKNIYSAPTYSIGVFYEIK
jgi:hypothetical protein